MSFWMWSPISVCKWCVWIKIEWWLTWMVLIYWPCLSHTVVFSKVTLYSCCSRNVWSLGGGWGYWHSGLPEKWKMARHDEKRGRIYVPINVECKSTPLVGCNNDDIINEQISLELWQTPCAQLWHMTQHCPHDYCSFNCLFLSVLSSLGHYISHRFLLVLNQIQIDSTVKILPGSISLLLVVVVSTRDKLTCTISCLKRAFCRSISSIQ